MTCDEYHSMSSEDAVQICVRAPKLFFELIRVTPSSMMTMKELVKTQATSASIKRPLLARLDFGKKNCS